MQPHPQHVTPRTSGSWFVFATPRPTDPGWVQESFLSPPTDPVWLGIDWAAPEPRQKHTAPFAKTEAGLRRRARRLFVRALKGY
jgi:hypothetical protein